MINFTSSLLVRWAHAVACVTLAALALSACATTKPKEPPVFIPPPPAQPRYQVLLTFGKSSDLGGGESKLSTALLGKQKRKETLLEKPYAAVMRKGKLYVTDTRIKSVIVVDFAAKKFERLKGAFGMGQLRVPINLAFDEQDNLYVTDAGRRQVVVFDRAGNHLRSIGDGTSFRPSGIAVTRDRIYLTDMLKHRVLILDRQSGKLLKDFKTQRKEKEMSGFPANLALDSQENIYVSEAIGARVLVFDRNGTFIKQIGELGKRLGQMVRPKGLAVDRRGRLYVADAATQHVQIFNRKGKLLLSFGGPRRTKDSLDTPAGLSLSYGPADLDVFRKYIDPRFDVEYILVVVSQRSEQKISVIGYLKKR